MERIALTIGGGSGPSYTIVPPAQVAFLDRLHIQNLVSFGITLLLTVAVLLSFFFVIFGGLKWMLSQGDKKQVEDAQKTITFAIIGLLVVFFSFFILNIIGFAFRVPLTGLH